MSRQIERTKYTSTSIPGAQQESKTRLFIMLSNLCIIHGNRQPHATASEEKRATLLHAPNITGGEPVEEKVEATKAGCRIMGTKMHAHTHTCSHVTYAQIYFYIVYILKI